MNNAILKAGGVEMKENDNYKRDIINNSIATVKSDIRSSRNKIKLAEKKLLKMRMSKAKYEKCNEMNYKYLICNDEIIDEKKLESYVSKSSNNY